MDQETNDMNTQRFALQGSGTYTAAAAFGGSPTPAPSSYKANTEVWNGTSWSEVADLNTARYYLASSVNGSSTSALAFGGSSGSSVTSTEQFTSPAPTTVTFTAS